MKPKLVPFFRSSSRAQKNEETIKRQIDGFEARWPELSKTYDLFQRVPGGTQQDQYFIDEGFNLETWDETTSFHEMMTLCGDREFDAIYVSEGDRLFRSRSNALRGRILDTLRDKNIKVIAKYGEISQSNLALEIISAVGAEDKRAFMHKCHEAKITRLKEENRPPTGRMPFCFRWDKQRKEWSLVENEVLLLKCAVGLSIGKIFDEMPEQVKNLVCLHPDGMNDRTVAEELSKLGFSKFPFYERTNLSYKLKNRATRDLTSSAIEKMLREDCYRGFLEVWMLNIDDIGADHKEPRKKTAYKIKVPRILSEEVWHLLQSSRRGRRNWAIHNLKYDYLCMDILLCAECGVPMAARPRQIKKYVRSRGEAVTFDFFYYTCARKPKVSNFRCTSGKHHKVEIIDDLVWKSFVSVLQKPNRLKALFEAGADDESRSKRRADLEKIVSQYEAELNELKSRRTRANRLLASDAIGEDVFSVQIKEIKSRQSYLERELSTLKKECSVLSRQPEVSGVVSEIAKINFTDAETTSFESRRTLLKSLVSRIHITNEGQITVMLKGGIAWQV